MKILRYRTIAEVYPHLSLEAEVQLNSGKIVYSNMDVNDEGLQENSYEDANWTYSVPLTFLDEDTVHEAYWPLSAEEEKQIFTALLELWNSNPVFDNDYHWKEV